MSATNDGGPAFPVTNTTLAGMSGMSLRDWFAGQFAASLILNNKGRASWPPSVDMELSIASYQMADAMLAAREKGKE